MTILDSTSQHPDEGSLFAYANGHLVDSEALAVKSHVDNCAGCEQVIESFRMVGQVAKASERVPTSFASHRMKRHLAESLEGERRTLMFRRWHPAQAMLGLILAMGTGAALAAVTLSGIDMGLFGQSAVSASKQVQPLQQTHAVQQKTFPVAPAQLEKQAADAAVHSGMNTTQKAGLQGAENKKGVGSIAKVDGVRKVVLEEAKSWPKRNLRRSAQKDTKRAARAAPARESSNQSLLKSNNLNSMNPGGAAKEPLDVKGTAVPKSLREGAENLKKQALLDETTESPWLDVGDAFALAGDANEATHAFVQALGTDKGYISAGRLFRLVAEDLVSSAEIMQRIENNPSIASSAEGMRLLCSWKLKEFADRKAVDACAAFAAEHPKHPAMRIHILAAGRVAESRLQDCELAVKHYSTAILVSQYSGISSTSAIFSRARCYEKLGLMDQATRDLELYLSIERTAVWRQEVAELMQKLNLTASPGSEHER